MKRESKMRRELRLLNEAVKARDAYEASHPGARLDRERREAIRSLRRNLLDPSSYLNTCPSFSEVVSQLINDREIIC